MPTLDPRFFIMPPWQITLFDKNTGFLLAGGIVHFLKDNNRTIDKPVYQLSLSPSNEYIYTELSNPLILSSTGTFVDEVGNQITPYLFPYDGTPTASNGTVELYYIRIQDSNGNLQRTVSAWPNNFGASEADNALFQTQNELLNPQFVDVLFSTDAASPTTTFTLTGTNTVTSIAPFWSIVTTGSGTVTVSRANVLDTTAESNPPYALDIQSSAGITSLALRQRLEESPRLLANQFICGTFMVNSQDGASHSLSMQYVPSSGTAHTIFNFSTGTSSLFQEALGTAQIDGVINPSPATTGYVDIIVTIPSLAHIQISSLQVSGIDTLTDELPFIEQSTAIQNSMNSSYYIPQLKFKEVESLLIGWDFTVNPAQFFTSPTTVGTTPAYVWDQTIMYATSNVTVTRNTITGGLQVVTGAASTSFYMLQYLSGAEVQKLLGTYLSSNVFAYCTTIGVTAPVIKIYLYASSASGSIPTLSTTVGTMDANGVFTLTAANWFEVKRGLLPTATATLKQIATNSDINSGCDYGFSGWQITDSTQIGSCTNFAMVITTYCASASATTTVFNSASLIPGLIACRPAPLSYQETLYNCSYFYEKSWAPGTTLAAANYGNAIMERQGTAEDSAGGGRVFFIARSFQVKYKTPKRYGTNLTLISPATKTSGTISASLVNNGVATTAQDLTVATLWNNSYNGVNNSFYLAYLVGNASSGYNWVVATTPTNPEALIFYHYVEDVRLGII